MGENKYKMLKEQLDELGYSCHLPHDAVPLVECLTADLLQTTKSLQRYMSLSKNALQQRDSLILESEPYKCDNAKLVKENTFLHNETTKLKEECSRVRLELKQTKEYLEDQMRKHEMELKKLRLKCRQYELKNISAETYSSRLKTKYDSKDSKSSLLEKSKYIMKLEDEITELNNNIENAQQLNASLRCELTLMKQQIENRNNEISRLHSMLEGGRPYEAVVKDCCYKNVDKKIIDMMDEIDDLKEHNKHLETQLQMCLDKQHEAMAHAVDQVEQNKKLQEEIVKVDSLALSVEHECNKQLISKNSEIESLQNKIKELQNRLKQQTKESTELVVQEKINLKSEIENLKQMNSSLENKISEILSRDVSNTPLKCMPTKDELENILDKERRQYEIYVGNIEGKLSEKITEMHKKQVHSNNGRESNFIKNLHNKICEKEQLLLKLKNENADLKAVNEMYMRNDIKLAELEEKLVQMNSENSELLKENLKLTEIVSKNKVNNYKLIDKNFKNNTDVETKITKLNESLDILKRERSDLINQVKSLLNENGTLKLELAKKQAQYENIYEENCSYRMYGRNEKAVVKHYKEEINQLKDEIIELKNCLAKEKGKLCQVKNMNLETEKHTKEIHNQLLEVRKNLSLNNDKIKMLEIKCKELQIENVSLVSEKAKLIENIKKIDKTRDDLILEIDEKTEINCKLEQKIKSNNYEIEKLKSELCEARVKLSQTHLWEHKLRDYETRMLALDEEMILLKREHDTTLMENKKYMDELAKKNTNLNYLKIEYDKSQKDVEVMKQQLQHYVKEVKRVEDLLTEKENERTEMLEHFASLSVEANILENNNHTLEHLSTSKSMQIFVERIKEIEDKLHSKDSIISSQASNISEMSHKICELTNEVKLLKEERSVLESNVSYLKSVVHQLESYKKNLEMKNDINSNTYEDKVHWLTELKAKLELEKDKLLTTNKSLEQLLKNARKEVIELKIAMQDATTETKVLKEQLNAINYSTKSQREYKNRGEPIEVSICDSILEDDTRPKSESPPAVRTSPTASPQPHRSSLTRRIQKRVMTYTSGDVGTI